jgi:L1 cell adhesion molecule like protein
VIWKLLYTNISAAEKGTLFQLSILIHRTSVPIDPQENMKAAEDITQVVLEAHITAAA